MDLLAIVFGLISFRYAVKSIHPAQKIFRGLVLFFYGALVGAELLGAPVVLVGVLGLLGTVLHGLAVRAQVRWAIAQGFRSTNQPK